MKNKNALTPPFIIPVGDGLVVPICRDSLEFNIKSAKPLYRITEYGVLLTLDRVEMPLSLPSLSHLLEQGQTLYFYGFDNANYMTVFLGGKQLERDSLLMQLGGWETLYGSKGEGPPPTGDDR